MGDRINCHVRNVAAFRTTRQKSPKLIIDHQRSAFTGAMIKYCLHDKKISEPRYSWLDIVMVSAVLLD